MSTPLLDTAPEQIHFLLLPKFSMLGFASALEPLRVANRFRGPLYQWHIVSTDGQAVPASDGISIMADRSIGDVKSASRVFVVAGFDPLDYYTTPIAAWLRRLDKFGTTLGAIDTGCFVLAEAGLLNREPITLHWEAIPPFRERYPSVTVTQELFEITARRITCAGGTAAIDMMLDLISRKHGSELAIQVSEQFVQGRIRDQSDHQRMQVAARYDVHNKKIAQIITMMEGRTEAPLSSNELADAIGVTCRQLERLFRIHLHTTPSNFYLGLRLDHARQLLQQTDMSVVEVGVACGFGSASYFSRAYRARFGVTPSHDRSKLRATAGAKRSSMIRKPRAAKRA
ncbi:MAG: GlxA family transcriptional regulator [Gammaproteobacteria bacterium]|nr:GlxA family transcriptional regulator [Gammaproteobacteria bacterium]